MEVKTLDGYRCSCGKLLFNGLLLISAVEIKCKRCGSINLFEGLEMDSPVSFDVDAERRVTRVHGDTKLLGGESDYFLGRPLAEMCPMLNDGPCPDQLTTSAAEHKPFHIGRNELLLKDGARLPVESYIAPRRENGVFSGYHIVNWRYSATKTKKAPVRTKKVKVVPKTKAKTKTADTK